MSLLLRRSNAMLPAPRSCISNSDWQRGAVSEEGPGQVTGGHRSRSCGSTSGWRCSQGRGPWAGAADHPPGDDSCLCAIWYKINATSAQPRVLLNCNSHLIFSETEWSLPGKSELPYTTFSSSAQLSSQRSGSSTRTSSRLQTAGVGCLLKKNRGFAFGFFWSVAVVMKHKPRDRHYI